MVCILGLEGTCLASCCMVSLAQLVFCLLDQIEGDTMDDERKWQQALQPASAFSREVLGVSTGHIPNVAQDPDPSNSKALPSRSNSGKWERVVHSRTKICFCIYQSEVLFDQHCSSVTGFLCIENADATTTSRLRITFSHKHIHLLIGMQHVNLLIVTCHTGNNIPTPQFHTILSEATNLDAVVLQQLQHSSNTGTDQPDYGAESDTQVFCTTSSPLETHDQNTEVSAGRDELLVCQKPKQFFYYETNYWCTRRGNFSGIPSWSYH